MFTRSPSLLSHVARAVAVGLVASASVAIAALPAHAAVATLTIETGGDSGTPQHYGSGFIYGLTEDGQHPSKDLLRGMGFNYNRAGGAQLDQAGGWRGGTYDRRFQATLNQYKTVTQLGGRFVLLPHDLYGIDGIGGVGAAVPGNGGDWTDYENFLERLISDVKKNDMKVDWDIWNEPDYPIFWPEPRTNPERFAQYLEMWRRTYVKLRAELPDARIVGPSTNEGPDERDSWWRGYLDYVKANDVVPDILSWHEIEGRYNAHDPVASKASAQAMLDSRGITGVKEFQINEYAAPFQQYPAMSAWYIARLERADIHGLRSHWGSAQNLHNDAAQLLYHEGDTYYTRGEYQTYAAYAKQSGTVVPVTTTTRNVDAYATRSDDGRVVSALIGSYNASGDVDVVAQRGGPVQPNARVRVVVEKIVEGNGQENRGPTFVSDTPAVVASDGTLTTTVDLETSRDAYLVTVKSADETTAADGRLDFGADLSQLRAGTTSTLTTIYKNNGSTVQSNVQVSLALPAGWTAQPTTKTIGTVQPGQAVDTAWEVSVPGAEVSKQRVVEVRADWDEAGQSLSSNAWVTYAVPCTVGFVCEWEQGTFTGTFLNTDHPGYTGVGFLGGLLGQGGRATLPFAIDKAGSYTATIRYAAGPDGPSAQQDRTMTLAAGQTRTQITLPRTTTWDQWSTVTVPLSLAAGTTEVTLSAEAGDTAWVNLDNVTLSRSDVDPEPATVSAQVTSSTPPSASGWYTSRPTLALTTTAGTIQYRVADGSWMPYTTPVELADGEQDVRYRAVIDGTPDVASEAGTVVKVDTVAPTVTAKGNPGFSGTTSSPARITLTAADATSGVGSVAYRLDEGDWTAYDGPIIVDVEGTTRVSYAAFDTAGNLSAIAGVDVVITGVNTTPSPTPSQTAPGTDVGESPRGSSAEGTPAQRNLALTGAETPWGIALAAALLISLGGVIRITRRRGSRA